jgi:hypothetical protein
MRILSILALLMLSELAFGQGEAEQALKALIAGDGSSIEYVGPALQAKLDEISPNLEACTVVIYDGDANPPIGDGRATLHAVVRCGTQSSIGLRLQRAAPGKFRVIGFWSGPST